MNRRLFISTQEAYFPPYTIIGANYIKTEGTKVKLETDVEKYKKNCGNILCSSEDEAIWFAQAIMATIDNPKDMVIDDLSKTVYHLYTPLKEVCFVYELSDPVGMLEEANKNSITTLQVNEE